ncbi:MarC family protein [Sediminitomix flava]|uniref:UPF0056 membrane protein n=1 Tax=Sediminitomix flava TaxID=379075 RepID=A0A315ZAT7_SEDFL|nr:MarC family protein [Sediminitomix flava]PWJ41834.1 multiple antibiotic resistance protein [Sediminitomix flava]
MLNEILKTFIAFFTVIDPIGTIPVFIAVTASSTAEQKNRMALKAATTAAGVLLFFIVIGELVLNAIGVSLEVFQIGGGIVLFLFALSMIFGESKPEEECSHIDVQDDKAIFPLAMPSLASPGAILAAILLTENEKHTITDQAVITIVMLSVILIAWIFMRLSSKLFKYIGNSGASIISRIMGLILTAVAIDNILSGITIYFGLNL